MNVYYDKIEKIRNKRGLSIDGVCRLTGITRTTLWRWEKGKQTPSETNMLKLARVLDVSVNEISDMQESSIIERQDFTNAVDSWQLLTQMDKKQQKDKFANIMTEFKWSE